jgi:hypothetical protein
MSSADRTIALRLHLREPSTPRAPGHIAAREQPREESHGRVDSRWSGQMRLKFERLSASGATSIDSWGLKRAISPGRADLLSAK